MNLGRSSGRASKECDCITNVEAADNIRIDKFTEETTIAKTVLALDGSMLGGILRGADGVKVGDHGLWDGSEGLGAGFTFFKLGTFPIVLEEEALDVGGAQQRGIVAGLVDVEAIVSGADTKFLEVNMFTFVILDSKDLVDDFVGTSLARVAAIHKSSTWRQRRIW